MFSLVRSRLSGNRWSFCWWALFLFPGKMLQVSLPRSAQRGLMHITYVCLALLATVALASHTLLIHSNWKRGSSRVWSWRVFRLGLRLRWNDCRHKKSSCWYISEDAFRAISPCSFEINTLMPRKRSVFLKCSIYVLPVIKESMFIFTRKQISNSVFIIHVHVVTAI